jgi:hypothetical protein
LGGQGGVPGNPGPTNTSQKAPLGKLVLWRGLSPAEGSAAQPFIPASCRDWPSWVCGARSDYLPTVSGGGSIGSWLINWVTQDGVGEVERRLCPDFTPDSRDLRLEPICCLRDSSNCPPRFKPRFQRPGHPHPRTTPDTSVELIFQRMVSSLPLEKLWEGKSRLRKVRDFQKSKDSAERIWL